MIVGPRKKAVAALTQIILVIAIGIVSSANEFIAPVLGGPGLTLLLFGGGAAYLWLDEIQPLLTFPLRVERGQVIPTRNSLVNVLLGRPPPSVPLESVHVIRVRWIPTNRVPSHSFVVRLRAARWGRFSVDNRLHGPESFRLLSAMAQNGQLKDQNGLLQALSLWNPATGQWESRRPMKATIPS